MSGLRVLHLHSSFSPGGKELRAARLMNAFGDSIEHVLVSGVRDQLGAAAAIERNVRVTYPDGFPELTGRPMPIRLLRIAQAMRGFDLTLTYNWGAMDAVAAHGLYARVLGLAPLVHHEDGFNQDEVLRRDRRRNLYRRLALRGAANVVVPSRQLEQIARAEWHVLSAQLRRIANGIDLAAYTQPAAVDALPGLVKQPGDRWVGTMAGLRAVKNLPRLVRAFAALPVPWQLVIVGEGPERAAIMAEAVRLGIGERVHLPGFAHHPARVMGLFDLFALSSDSEQFPISVVEAMACGLAVVSPAVGDVAAMVAPANRDWITAPGDEAGLTAALAAAAGDSVVRSRIGQANRVLAARDYDEASMIAEYSRVYAAALGRAHFP